MNNQLIFEIGTEEIPAGYLTPAVEALKKNMAAGLSGMGLTFGQVTGAATPRRLVVRVDALMTRQPDRVEEILGPPKKAGFDANNQPTKAAEGFAKSRGAEVADIQIASTAKGEYLMLRQEQKGLATTDLLPGLLSEMIRSTPFPKSMRWGATKTTFARPIQWLLAIYGGQAIPMSIDGAGDSGRVTYGHRFMAPQMIEVSDYDQYVSALREQHVLVEAGERRAMVLADITMAAQAVGGTVLADDELVETVANLVEYPHAICGSFDPKFLDLPKDALITSMREHQKYFAVVDDKGQLMANFIAVNNTKVKDPALGAEGHQRVLRARLEDGLFFFREDQRAPLSSRVADLNGLVFQNKLGTMLEKTNRVQALAGELAKLLYPALLDQVSRAAYLAKADLLTAMVNEFPSLQGAMGRDYARLNGEDEVVAEAIYEHYMPVRADSQLPEGVIGAIVGIADRIDTMAGCFGIGQIPTGSTDPFGLRRQALGLIRIIERHGFAISLPELTASSLALYGDKLTEDRARAQVAVVDFIKGRYANDQVARGIAAEAVEAVVSVSFADIIDSSHRINALLSISAQPSFPLLAGAFKRVMNIIKDHQGGSIDTALLSEEAEHALHQVLIAVSGEAQPLIDQAKYEAALAVILKMKEPVDLFFEKVMVMAEDMAVRNNRLSLLAAIAALFLQIGDFSKLSGQGAA
ncbi:MAG: glycine--tRNA ligase subunit beta [Proteobacteria bacterium]|nr:glycine--tRNA ligase subunit beta [Pseudomonadota bacterium]MDP2106799.1 glycine--tRNA ligase subunit beta [Desulfobulbaceae bacterium]